ncbi:MAG: sulfurtransferase [Ardenticatenales bacterium]|nr:sulfurtransferase [Ardenticatenales bacterium]
MAEYYSTLISAEALREHLGDPAWAVVDCRFKLDDPAAGRARYLEAHIPGAIYADLNKDLSALATPDEGRHPLPALDTFRATLGAWGIAEGVQVVCYDDQGGSIAARLWWMLRYLGHEAIAVLDGGLPTWRAQGYSTASGAETRPPAHFQGEPHPEMLASMDELLERSPATLLIDSREAARYRGEIEPIDRVAGHIPGARNRPFAQNLAPAGTLRPAEELAETWQSALGTHAAEEVVVYCGSGVTACHNLLALEVSGLSGARLFVPSWSGWSASPERPVAVGEEPP